MESQNQKVDEFMQKLKSLGDRAKQARSSLGSPIVDRLLDRVSKVSNRLPPDGHAPQEAQREPQQEAKISCPKCGVQAAQGSNFCVSCGFDFQEAARQRAREGFEREKLERSGRMGVISGG